MSKPAEQVNSQDEPIVLSSANGVAEIMFNRPARYNTLSREALDALASIIPSIAADETIRCVVIAARGKAFSSGHDIKQMHANRGEQYYRQLLSDCSQMMQSLIALPQPVIARVQGIATAAGCQLVATCDLAIAGASATFATNGINNGLFCATPAVAVGRTVPRKKALELLFTGDFVDAQTAAEIGLINRVVPDDELDAAVAELANKIASKSAFAIRLGKASFYRQINQPLDAAYRSASADLVCNLLADDGIEGVNAFVEKRDPKWS